MKVIIFLLALLITAAFPVMAQEDPCPSVEAVEEILAVINEGGDAMEILNKIVEISQKAKIACSGLIFTSAEYGAAPVIGPVTLEEGTYRVGLEARAQLNVSVDITELSGSCGVFIGSLFAMAENGTQKVMQTRGCEALLTVSYIDMNFMAPSPGEWTLTFEKVR